MATPQKHDLTQATDITAEVVLEQGKLYDAKDFRKVQTGLSSAARELRALTQYGNSIHGRLGAQLSHEQRELLSNAAALLDSVKYNVEHAKERKAREEKAAAKLREQRERQAKQLVAQHFQLPTTTVEQQVEVVKLYIAIRTFTDGWRLKEDHHLRDMMLSPAPSWTTTKKWRLDQVTSLIADLKSSVEYHLVFMDQSPSQRLASLQQRIAEVREAQLSKPSAQETIRIWTEALLEVGQASVPASSMASSQGGAA
ncbi:hypothetical protein SB18R_23745 [Pseudomonas oryzihabitans]|nr:hypothetical protein NS201_07825 [Pseudomonas psychrotolerans]KTT36916.1 hypothetical protein SB9_04050 [Pseudomonas psychrotolerans]KTT70045.1 hypothetical protein SB18R_23745 [Pseudomonas psychrotolerans]